MIGPYRDGGGVRSARGRLLLRCPRCGLGIRPRVSWLAIEHCPRCLARARTPVKLVASGLPPAAHHPRASASGNEGSERAELWRVY